MSNTFDEIRAKASALFNNNEMLNEKIAVKARPLSVEEAIGNPESNDFPIQKGNEKLMQAKFRNSLGQAFTDLYGDFSGTLGDVLKMDLKNNYRRSIFIATINAVLRDMGLIEKTIHCKDQEPEICAEELTKHIQTNYGEIKIVHIGFQPKMIEHLSKVFNIRVMDMDIDNIGEKKYGVMIEAPFNTDDALNWADLALVTGTTLSNDTIDKFIGVTPAIFYGTTIAGAAYLMGWNRFCHCAK